MITRYYQFSGVKVALSMPEELLYEKEGRLAPFRVDALPDPICFRFEKVERLSAPEGTLVDCQGAMRVYSAGDRSIRYLGFCMEDWEKAQMRAEFRERSVDIQLKNDSFPNRMNIRHVLDCLAAEHLIARNDGFIFHCSCIDRGGKAILFTAPSETGKSTQADLWAQYRGAEIINGDRAAVRLVNGVLMAEGIPFAGSSKYCKNRSLPIEAVVYLGQAPVTTIRKLRGYEAFSKIWEGVSVNTWDREDLERVSAVAKNLVETVPVYHMPCTPDEAAVIALEQQLKAGE